MNTIYTYIVQSGAWQWIPGHLRLVPLESAHDRKLTYQYPIEPLFSVSFLYKCAIEKQSLPPKGLILLTWPASCMSNG